MQHDFFLVEGEETRALTALFESTPFFKAVVADAGNAILKELLDAETKQFTDEKRFLDQYLARRDSAKSVTNTDSDDRKYRDIEPAWWNWRSPLPLVDRSVEPADLALRQQPRVLASFDGNQRPFVIERKVGAGRVVQFTSGVTSNWNLLRGSGAMYLFHRTFCQLMEGTLPTRNYLAGQKITLPIERRADVRLSVTRPSGLKETLTVDAISATALGVTVRRPLTAGAYTISAEQTDSATPGSAANTVDEFPLAVNGAEAESNLATISEAELQQKLGHDNVRVLSADDPIRIEGGSRRGQDLWKLCGWCVLGCLLLEQLILAWPMLRKQ
jgi:hypothetical protein